MASMSGAEQIAALSEADRADFIGNLTEEECNALMYDWRGFNARPNQVAPEGDWDIWLLLAGRGFGKTRSGAELIREMEASGYRRFALIGETAADTRDVMVEGESGLLSIYPKHERPIYYSSKRRIVWPSGAVATLFNATEPDQLRGPQFDGAWCDELAKWRYARATWDQLQFGMRLGDNPRQVVTTTPRNIELVKSIVNGDEGKVAVTGGNTMDNVSNLATKFLSKIRNKYEGTRLGRQELNAEILGDIPNALWTLTNIDLYRVRDIPELGTIGVSVDVASGGLNHNSKKDIDGELDEHGIIVGGITEDGSDAYVIDDVSIKGTPEEWAQAAINAYDCELACKNDPLRWVIGV